MVELTIAEKLKQLYELQLVDSQIDEIEVLKGELPMEVSDLEDDIAGLETRVARLESNVKELEEETNRHVANIKESEALILRYKVQMDNVKNNREYEALTKEIEMQNLEIQLSEKRVKQARMDVDAKKETLHANQEKLAKKQKDLENKRIELSQIIAKTEKEEERLRQRSEAARIGIEDRLMLAYDKIRTSYRNGLAVVTIARDACGGCFNMIPPQMQLEIAQRKKIVACEHCGRILVDESIVEEVKQNVNIAETSILDD